jgi:hypothetical protein
MDEEEASRVAVAGTVVLGPVILIVLFLWRNGGAFGLTFEVSHTPLSRFNMTMHCDPIQLYIATVMHAVGFVRVS